MKILYKNNIYDVCNKLTEEQFISNGGEIYKENNNDINTTNNIPTKKNDPKVRGRKRKKE